jgi:argininosuccinate lyase
MSFREAYVKVGKDIQEGKFESPIGGPGESVLQKYSHEGSMGNLCLEEIRKKFDTVK